MQKYFNAYKSRGGFDNKYTLPEFINITLNKLTEDKIYQKEYSDFVSSIHYAKEFEVITFEKAINNLEILYEFIKKNN